MESGISAQLSLGGVPLIPAKLEPDVTEMLLSDDYTTRGMASNYQVLVHSHPCIADPPINFFEIDLCIVLARHLLLQSYQSNDFVIVTTNAFQLKHIKQATRLLEEFNTAIPVIHIDEYINDLNLKPKVAIVSFANLHDTCTGENVDPIVFSRIEKFFEVLFGKQSLGLYMLVNASLFNLSANLKELGLRLKSIGCINTSLKIKCCIHGAVNSICSSEQLLDTAPDGGCTKLCLYRHGCGHDCPLQCHSLDREHKMSKYSCKYRCEKLCPRGHASCRRLCYEPCSSCDVILDLTCRECGRNVSTKCSEFSPRCKELMKKKFKGCGHQVEFYCYESREKKSKCTFMLTTTMPCGHIKEYRCCDQHLPSSDKCMVLVTIRKHPEITTHVSEVVTECHKRATIEKQPCTEMVLTDFVTVCGHQVVAPCNEHRGWLSSTLPKYCKEKCFFPKRCGHPCAGSCQDCQHGIFHIRCTAVQCTKPLECGHACSATCSNACIPCEKPCQISCEHGKCKNVCSFPCTMCEEPCQWQCQHFKCTKKCSEPCDREPCLKPCPIKLSCGHDCVGFCGEPCPPICRVCNGDELNGFDVLCEEDENKESRFVWFKDGCGHILEYQSLLFLLSTPDPRREINYKTCPFCRGIIWNCRPFDSVLAPIRNAINQRKRESFGNEDVLLQMKKDIFVEVQVQECSTRSFESRPFLDFKDFLMIQLCGNERNADNGIFLELPIQALSKLETFSKYYKTSTDRMLKFWHMPERERSSLRDEIADMYEKLEIMYDRLFLFIMSRKHPLYNNEVLEINREVNRLSDFYRVIHLRIGYENQRAKYSRRRQEELDLDPAFETAMGAIYSLCPYELSVRKIVYESLKIVDDVFIDEFVRSTMEETQSSSSRR